MPEISLRPVDVQSETWRRLSQILRDRLQALRERNDSKDLNEVQTAVIRGQIAEVKQTLALADSASALADEPPGEWPVSLHAGVPGH